MTPASEGPCKTNGYSCCLTTSDKDYKKPLRSAPLHLADYNLTQPSTGHACYNLDTSPSGLLEMAGQSDNRFSAGSLPLASQCGQPSAPELHGKPLQLLFGHTTGVLRTLPPILTKSKSRERWETWK